MILYSLLDGYQHFGNCTSSVCRVVYVCIKLPKNVGLHLPDRTVSQHSLQYELQNFLWQEVKKGKTGLIYSESYVASTEEWSCYKRM